MEQTNKPNLMKSTMTSGAIMAAGLLIFTLILYMTNLLLSAGLNYLSYLIVIGGIILGIKNYKDQEEQGFISYGRAFGVGMLTVLFASVIMAIFMYVLYSVIDPGLIEKTLELTRTKMADQHLTDDQVEMALNMSKKFVTPGVIALGTIVAYGFIGAIISLIAAAFMKKDKPVF